MKRGHIVAFAVLVLAAVGTLVSFSGAVAKHVSVADAKRMAGQTVQVPGRIVKNSIQYSVTGTRGELQFDITDMVAPDQTMRIVYARPKPENFETATSVEAVGRFDGSVFRAHNLLVKCPSKYESEKGAGR